MKNIAAALDMTPLHEIQDQELVEYTPVEQLNEIDNTLEEASEDYKQVRFNIKKMIEESQDVFDTARLMAISSQETKSVEAFARILDSLVKTNKELMNVHRDMFALQPPAIEEPKSQTAETINNIIFSGSASDLFRLLKDKGVTSLPDN